jgi:hypothetical protein
VTVLPVIGISPKALQQHIKAGTEAQPECLIDLLNRYKYFSCIEPTTQSKKLGKYLFITMAAQFDEAKLWITTDLPQIWATLDHTFIEELPDTVQCPRLTTSNLEDATTSRTVAMLNASRVPDEVTVASKWSQPPQLGRNRQPSCKLHDDGSSGAAETAGTRTRQAPDRPQQQLDRGLRPTESNQ